MIVNFLRTIDIYSLITFILLFQQNLRQSLKVCLLNMKKHSKDIYFNIHYTKKNILI